MSDTSSPFDLFTRLDKIAALIELGMQCTVRVGHTQGKGDFVQIQCWREDTITKEMGYGFGGKAYPSEHATDSEIIQMIFGLYKSYWEHEARETFILHHPETGQGRRPFGPHIDTWALWDVARRVDVRSQKHAEDADAPKDIPGFEGTRKAIDLFGANAKIDSPEEAQALVDRFTEAYPRAAELFRHAQGNQS